MPEARFFLDKAILSEKGIKIKFPSRAEAFRFRMNCYTARKRERDAARRMYEPGDPLFDKSPWEDITALLMAAPSKDGKTYVYLVNSPHLAAGVSWEPLSDEDLNFLGDMED